MIRSVILASVFLFSTSSFSQDEEVPNEPTIAEKFYSNLVAPVVQANCTGCHNSGFASGDVVLETAEQLIENRETIALQVQDGLMPLGNPEWKDSNDATLLLYWLEQQAPEEVPEVPGE